MRNEYDFNFAPQGWQCPVCKRVYSPSYPWCIFCGNETTTTTTTTTIPQTPDNWLDKYKEVLDRTATSTSYVPKPNETITTYSMTKEN